MTNLLDGWYAKTETRRQGSSAGSTDTCACPRVLLPTPVPPLLRRLRHAQLFFSSVDRQEVPLADRSCSLAWARCGVAAQEEETKGGLFCRPGDGGRGIAAWHGEASWFGRHSQGCQGRTSNDIHLGQQISR